MKDGRHRLHASVDRSIGPQRPALSNYVHDLKDPITNTNTPHTTQQRLEETLSALFPPDAEVEMEKEEEDDMVPPLVGLPLLEAATDALEEVQRRVSPCMFVVVGRCCVCECADLWMDGWMCLMTPVPTLFSEGKQTHSSSPSNHQTGPLRHLPLPPAN